MDYKEYHQDWRDIIRPSILKRDAYKCRVCGIRHKIKVYRNSTGNYVEVDEFLIEWCKANGKKAFVIYLTVAHIDHNKMNNEPINLITLCPRHHSIMDADHKKFMRIVQTSKVLSQSKNSVPGQLAFHEALLPEVRTVVKQITGINIQLHEADAIASVVLKFLENE